ncbi:(2Fe-2S)-binding protein [Lacrimispora sp.]|uniref:(2Fe-2S)-binding protein n=1 Tax=Lacrimispora sp. TaxID=2719234 RepID=UPI0028AE22B1|nr:(2Fe-2S)-binding protein [Lacrimispora sp.]
MDNQEIIDKLTKVCICKGVSKQTIKKAISEGADTVEKVWSMTNTGNGSCKGKRCGEKIRQILDDWEEEK